MRIGFLAGLLTVALMSGWFTVWLVGGPVTRSRVERFARRQQLEITVGNGNLVISYLAVTRRWRTIGLVSGVLLAAAWAIRDQRVTLNLTAAFVGWFVGALIAEFRIAGATPGARRTASLEPRLLRTRLRPAARLLPPVLVGLSLGLAVALLVLEPKVTFVDVLRYPVAAAVALAVPALVGRHVLNRAVRLDVTADVRAADEALRDRSLHVLAGCAVALTAYPAILLCYRLIGTVPDDGVAVELLLIAFLMLLFTPILGWAVATGSARAGRPLTVGTEVGTRA